MQRFWAVGVTYGLASVATDCGSGCGLRSFSPRCLLNDRLEGSLFVMTLLTGSIFACIIDRDGTEAKESIGSDI